MISLNANQNFDGCDDDDDVAEASQLEPSSVSNNITNNNIQCNTNLNDQNDKRQLAIDNNFCTKTEKNIKLNRNYDKVDDKTSSTKFKIRINKTVHERLSLNEKKKSLYVPHYKEYSRSRSRSSYSSDGYSSKTDDDDMMEIKRTKKLQSVIAKAIDNSNIKCMFF